MASCPPFTLEESDNGAFGTSISDLEAARLELYNRDEHQSGGSAVSAWARERDIRLGPVFDLHYTTSLLPVRFVQNGRFEFADDGQPGSRPAIIVEALAEDDDTVVDLLAADVAEPRRLASMFGWGQLLGLSHAVNPATYFGGQPLRVFRSVEGWLRAGCGGAVLVTPDAAWLVLAGLPGPIGAEDLEHARELLRLTHPFLVLDRILVWSDHL